MRVERLAGKAVQITWDGHAQFRLLHDGGMIAMGLGAGVLALCLIAPQWLPAVAGIDPALLGAAALVGGLMAFAWGGFLFYVVLFGAGLAAVYYLHPVSPLAARIVSVILFTAMLEELFFRGYLQTRLNEGFGMPFSFLGVNFGLGVILAAVLFGLFHPLSATSGTPWPWALWTGAFGLILGLMREKTGSILAPGLLHGLILVPSVFAGPAG